MKILFLLKRGQLSYGSSKAGLITSARLVKDYLEESLHIACELKICVDGNSIDREVFLFKPDYCILEAIWVTPEKLRELTKLHPKVIFVIRVHSEIPFLSQEGCAIEWLISSSKIPNVKVAFNSLTTIDDFRYSTGIRPSYLPNIYEHINHPKTMRTELEELQYYVSKFLVNNWIWRISCNPLNVGCFGAIRPFKNQLLQAMAAIQFADNQGVRLRFHINSERVEQGGESVLKNLRSLFRHSHKHQLIEHPWMKRHKFLEVVSEMDVGMQASFNESFNIVTADFVKEEIPIIVSNTIEWMPSVARVDPNSQPEMVAKLAECLFYRNFFVDISKVYLGRHNHKAQKAWQHFLKV